ncbi:WxL domain-containing protein [bacterium]|nr:WxL domain-containing protein [bacterium]
MSPKALLPGLILTRLALAQGPAISTTNSIQVNLSGSSLQLQVAGPLDFGTRTLTGAEQRLRASSGPSVQLLDATGTGAGWSVTLQTSDFVGPAYTIPSRNLSFQAQGGSILWLAGQPVGAGGPAETNQSGALNQPLKGLSAQAGSGMGTYQWRPSPSAFELLVPLEARAGTYQAQLTFSIFSGP